MIINGTGFVDGATVTFGGSAATSVIIVNAFTITCLTPAHAVGLVDVVVTNPDGQSATLTNGYRYSTTFDSPGLDDQFVESTPDPPAPDWTLVDSPNPTVLSVVASSGTKNGGTRVIVTGTDFDSGASVTFGGSSAINVIYINSKAIVCTTPAHAIGAVSIVVTNGDSKTGTLSNGYLYINPPATVISISPLTGTKAGGTTLTITGTDFVDPVIVTIGGLTGLSPTVVNAQIVTAITPAHAIGEAEVTVENTT